MAHYQYEGLHFELPDGLSNDEAIAKIEAHLGKRSPAIPGQEGEADRVAKLKAAKEKEAKANPYKGLNDALLGVGETALSVGSSLFTSIQAPVAAGIKRAAGMVPDWEQETARLMQEQTYQPRTEKGQDISQSVGEFVNRYLAPMGPGNLTGLAQAKGGVPLRTPKERPVETPAASKAPSPQAPVAPQGLAPDGLPMAVEGDLFNRRAYQQELPLASSVETIADMQRARNNPNQLDLFGDNSGGQRMPYDAEGIKLREEAAKAAQEAQAARTAQEHAAALERYRQAQNAIEQREQAMRQEVARQTSLDLNAAQRARQEAAPTGYSSWDANRQVTDATQSAEQLRRLNEEGQQMGIVEDYGNNDPMSRMPNMRVDENGIPIRADLSMEAQNLQNPLQRNLFGDELPIRTGDNGIPLTQALDRMPPGPARDAAVSQLSGQPVNPAALTDAVNSKLRLRKNQGAIHPQVFEDLYKFGKSVIRTADGLLMPLYHGTNKEFRNIKASTEGGALGNGVYTAVRPQYSNGYAEGLGGNVHQVYVDIRKPLVIDAPGDPMINALISLGETREKAIKIVEKAYDEKGYITNEVRARARRQGYDGIVLKRNGQMSEVVAFDAKQVKSALSGDNNPPARRMTEKELSGDWEAEPDTWKPSIRTSGRFGQQGAIMMDMLLPKRVVDKVESWRKAGGRVLIPDIHRMLDDLGSPSLSNDVREILTAKYLQDGFVEKYQQRIERALANNDFDKAQRYYKRMDSHLMASLINEELDGYSNYNPDQQEYRASTGLFAKRDAARTETERLLAIAKGPKGIPGVPGGSIHPDLLTLGIPKAFEKLSEMVGRNKEPIADYLNKLPGLRGKADEFITRPTPVKDVLEAAKAQADGPDLAVNWQTGLSMAAKKGNSIMLDSMGKWFNWSQNRASYLVREAVVPLEKTLAKLGKDLTTVHRTFIEEMFQRERLTPEQLADRGLNQKTIDAIEALRRNFDLFFDEQNAARAAQGKKPITRQEAYMASVFRGDYHLPIYDKTGKLRFYIQTPTRKQTQAAIAWLKKEFADSPDFDFSKLEYNHSTMYNPGRKYGAVPRDVMSSWKDIAEAMGDDPLAAEIKQAMERWVEAKGTHAFKQDLHHVKEKINVRGFEGDQPWLSPEDNAHNWARAQIEYLKDAARWSATQEAIGQVKQFVTDPTIMDNQPRNMMVAKAYMYNHMGLTENLAKSLEAAAAGSVGLSREVVNNLASVLRNGIYIKTLTASPFYMIAAPLQAIHASVGWFTKEAQAGNVTMSPVKFAKSLFSALSDERIGSYTPFEREALKWAEDNGVIKNIVYEDDRSIGAHPVADKLQWVSDASIGLPDRFARRLVYLPFAQALWDSGKFPTKEAAFRHAGEIADTVAVSMRPQDRPLIVQKLGTLGTMGYVFHAPIFNMYNQLSVFARMAAKGNKAPLIAYLSAMAAIGGIWNLPGFNELEKGFEGFKTLVAEAFPNQYKHVKDINPKVALLKALPEVNVLGHTGGEALTYGLGSLSLGADMRGRFSNEIINAEDPVGSIFPGVSVYGDVLKSAGKAITNPNAYTGMQLLKDMAPGGLARGLIETNSDRFKAPVQPYADQGITSFRKPSDISDPTINVNRNESEITMRKYGGTALSEAKRREVYAMSKREAARLDTARKGVFDSMFKAIVNKTGDENTVREAVQNYLALEGNPQDIANQLNTKFKDLSFSPEQLQMLKAKRYSQIMDVVRRLEMEKR